MQGGGQSGGFFSPGNMWLGLGVIVLVFVAWRSFSPQPSAPTEPTATLEVTQHGQTQIVKVNRRDCLAQEGRVWAVIEGGVECMSYVTAGAITGSDPVLVYFSGDVPEGMLAEASQASARAPNQRRAERTAETFGVSTVIVGRPGLMGSSGFHFKGGRRDEAQVIDATIDALKDKLQIRRLALAGQSGGARIIAQLMVSGRRDIACAGMASGAYDVPRLVGGGRSSTNIFGDPGQRYLVPLLAAERVVSDPGRRSFVIGDTRDKITPFTEQKQWAEKLAALGHHAVLIEAQAKDPEFHGLSEKALTAAALCAKGTSDAEIRRAVQG